MHSRLKSWHLQRSSGPGIQLSARCATCCCPPLCDKSVLDRHNFAALQELSHRGGQSGLRPKLVAQARGVAADVQRPREAHGQDAATGVLNADIAGSTAFGKVVPTRCARDARGAHVSIGRRHGALRLPAGAHRAGPAEWLNSPCPADSPRSHCATA